MDKVLEKIINESVGLIWEIAKKFYGIDKADLYQAGVLGIIIITIVMMNLQSSVLMLINIFMGKCI